MDRMAEVGRVIAVAGSLETLLELHGARGTGLREKTESLRDRLPPEALSLSRRVGMVRNRIAHEPETPLSEEELLQYEETAREFARLIGTLDHDGAGTAAGEPSDREKAKEDPPASEDEEKRKDEKEAETPPSPAAGQKRYAAVKSPFPRLPRQLWALVPGVHLAVLVWKILQSLQPGWWYWTLFLTLPLSGGTGWYYYGNRAMLPQYWLWIAAGWLAAGWFGSVLTALAEKREHPRLSKLAFFPVLHVLYLLSRIGQNIRYGLFFAALTGLAAQVAAVWFTVQAEPEWLTASILTGCSLFGAFLLALFF